MELAWPIRGCTWTAEIGFAEVLGGKEEEEEEERWVRWIT